MKRLPHTTEELFVGYRLLRTWWHNEPDQEKKDAIRDVLRKWRQRLHKRGIQLGRNKTIHNDRVAYK